MYILDKMIDLGLKEGEKFTSLIHKKVAQEACLCNPSIHTRYNLINAVRIINSIPVDRISTLTAQELIEEFKFPYL